MVLQSQARKRAAQAIERGKVLAGTTNPTGIVARFTHCHGGEGIGTGIGSIPNVRRVLARSEHQGR
jgi:cytochrome c553